MFFGAAAATTATHPPTPSTTVSRGFWAKRPKTFFRNDSFHRCDRFCQIFVQIGAILAIFRPFEVFGRFLVAYGADYRSNRTDYRIDRIELAKKSKFFRFGFSAILRPPSVVQS